MRQNGFKSKYEINKIELTNDLMILDNDEAEKRHGVQLTYKGVKGFESSQIIWNRKIVDSAFLDDDNLAALRN